MKGMSNGTRTHPNHRGCPSSPKCLRKSNARKLSRSTPNSSANASKNSTALSPARPMSQASVVSGLTLSGWTPHSLATKALTRSQSSSCDSIGLASYQALSPPNRPWMSLRMAFMLPRLVVPPHLHLVGEQSEEQSAAADPTIPPHAILILDGDVVDGLPAGGGPEERAFGEPAVFLADDAKAVLLGPPLEEGIRPREVEDDEYDRDGGEEEEEDALFHRTGSGCGYLSGGMASLPTL